MKRSLIVLLIVITTATSMMAQNAAISWGAKFDRIQKKQPVTLVRYDPSGIILLAPTQNAFGKFSGMAVMSFDATLKLKASDKLPLECSEGSLNYAYTGYLGQQVVVFSSSWDRIKKVEHLYASRFDSKKLSIEAPVKIAEINYSSLQMKEPGKFYFANSLDSSVMGIVYCGPNGMRPEEKFFYTAIDINLHPVYSNNCDFSYEGYYFTPEKMAVATSGKIYFSGAFVTGKPEAFMANTYKNAIIALDIDCKTALIMPEPTDIHAAVIQIACNKKNDLLCCGFYGGAGRGGGDYKGCFYSRIDGVSDAIIQKEFRDFPEKVLTAGTNDEESDKDAKGGSSLVRDLSLWIIQSGDGEGFSMAGESNYSITRTYTSSSGASSISTTYYSGNIIVAHISNQGTIEEIVAVPKKQKSSDDEQVGSFLISAKEQNSFIFTDHPDNNAIQGQAVKSANFGGNGVVTIATIDAIGHVKRETLYTYKENGALLCPPFSCFCMDGIGLLIGIDGAKSVLGLVTVKK